MKKFHQYTIVNSQQTLADGIMEISLLAPEIARQVKPGQFVNLYTEDSSLLLPRPISVYDACPEEGLLRLIYAVVGKGTEAFQFLGEGDKIRITGPLGNGFPVERVKESGAEEILLVGGGLGIPPLYYLAKTLHTLVPDVPIATVLGFRSTPWIFEAFEPFGRVIAASDDGASGFKGNVVDLLQAEILDPKRPRILYTCGPVPMMRAIQAWQKDYAIESWFSLEERMGCGFGACAGCPAKIRQQDGSVKLTGICKQGPVFLGKDVVFS